jgi:hypothetical protein
MTTSRTKLIASLAVVGTVAAVAALVGMNAAGSTASSALGHSRLLASSAVSASDAQAFQAFVVKHNRNYITKEEFSARQAIFAANVAHINAHDAVATGYTLGINKFADLTEAEFNSMKGLKVPAAAAEASTFLTGDIGEEVDVDEAEGGRRL